MSAKSGESDDLDGPETLADLTDLFGLAAISPDCTGACVTPEGGMMIIQISFAGALRLAILALPVAAASAFAVPKIDAASVSEVLQEVKAHAADANYDAEILDSYVRSRISWKSYSERLNEIRRHANDLFHDYSRMQKMADSATPQQREAINHLEPIVREMADSLVKTIESLNDNQRVVNMPEFSTRIHSDYVIINRVYQELCKCVDDNAV